MPTPTETMVEEWLDDIFKGMKFERITEGTLEKGDIIILKIPQGNLPRVPYEKYVRRMVSIIKEKFPDHEVMALPYDIDIEILKTS